jgi:cytochrome c
MGAPALLQIGLYYRTIRAENGVRAFEGAIRMRLLIWAAAALVATTGLAGAQDVEAGEKSFRKCLPCHAVGEDARHKIGPFLNGLEGRKSGTIEGYNYSEANKKAEIVWSEASFKDYIQNPMAKVPGTKMAFAGIKNEKEIADLWAYLKQFKADGKK